MEHALRSTVHNTELFEEVTGVTELDWMVLLYPINAVFLIAVFIYVQSGLVTKGTEKMLRTDVTVTKQGKRPSLLSEPSHVKSGKIRD